MTSAPAHSTVVHCSPGLQPCLEFRTRQASLQASLLTVLSREVTSRCIRRRGASEAEQMDVAYTIVMHDRSRHMATCTSRTAASLALMAGDEWDFETEPLRLAPSTLEKALRLPLAALPLGGVALELLDIAHEHYSSAIARTVGEITAETGAERLIQRIRDDPVIRATVVEALSAAARTGFEAKRRALGKIVTTAILDDARIDESQLLVIALHDLEGPHVRALTRAARAQGVDVTDWDESRNQERVQVVTAVDAVLTEEPTAVIATLLRTGAITQDGLTYATLRANRVTDFGIAILVCLSDGEQVKHHD